MGYRGVKTYLSRPHPLLYELQCWAPTMSACHTVRVPCLLTLLCLQQTLHSIQGHSMTPRHTTNVHFLSRGQTQAVVPVAQAHQNPQAPRSHRQARNALRSGAVETGEMTSRVRVLAALPEDLSLVPTQPSHCYNSNPKRSNALFWPQIPTYM